MAVITFNGLDALEETNSIYSIIGEDEEVEMVGDGVYLEYFGVILLDLFDRFIGVDLLAVNGAILVSSNKHMLVPDDGSIIDFPGVVELE